MRLTRFKVTGFRSVVDSGWVEVDDVTALIGENESGKTNILIPLWKLNPASPDGAIDPIADYPRKRFHEIRAIPDDKKPIFIRAQFEIDDDDLLDEIVELTGADEEDVRIVEISRTFGDKTYLQFPRGKGGSPIPRDELAKEVEHHRESIGSADAPKPPYEAAREQILALLDGLIANGEGHVSAQTLTDARAAIAAVGGNRIAKASQLAERQSSVLAALDSLIARASRKNPNDTKEARQKAFDAMPKFVYYSSYGNLDSEIYLPHVIHNMQRLEKKEHLGAREAAKARTLKVLFEFVKLKPKEILELGRPLTTVQNQYGQQTEPTQDQIEESAEHTKEREILLTSAASSLTEKFRDWWKRGEYRFRFQADGNHFRIWVSDSRRPEEIELEGRSSGLQWFFSFFLVFLVERADQHEDAILLLDEPGMSLHPLAQKDLSRFFEALAKENQILYTSHSPFLVDPDHLDQVKVVYIDDAGATAISSNLRAAEKEPSRTKSIYAVHAALGLSVSETLLIGANAVIVEGPADQIYMGIAKTMTIGNQLFQPSGEMVFVAAGGARGTSTVASILASSETYPAVIVDADSPGRAMAESLRKNLYAGQPDRVFSVGDYATVKDAEIEDLMPASVLASAASRTFRAAEEDFSDVHDPSQPMVPQLEAFANKHAIKLEHGWKVELARAFAQRVRRKPDEIPKETLALWARLLADVEGGEQATSA